MNLSLFPVVAIVLIVAVSGCTQQLSSNTSPEDIVQPDGSILKPDGTIVQPDGTMKKPDGTVIKPDGTMIGPGGEVTEPSPPSESSGYSGQVLAGSATPYIRYNEADFQKARSEGKVIFLYFYASWCPICNAERPDILAAFNEMSYSDVVGFEVHFNDQHVTASDQAITREYQIPYQHTSLVLDSTGSVSLKSTQPLGKEGIKSTIANARS